MALHKNSWRPDTCDCELEYEWDDSVPQEERVTTISSILKACPIHAHHGDNIEGHYSDVLAENQSKNQAIGLLVKTLGKLDGGAEEISWRFNPDRSIVLSHPALTKQDKETMNALEKTDISKQVSFE